MQLLITFLFITHLSLAFAALTITDKDKLATVNLHTELINSTKRVYLAADFEAMHKKGLIACELTVEHKNGMEKGPVYKLVEDTSLLPNEKIPFNLGLFPESFHASGLDVKANLICHKVTYFDAKPLLKNTQQQVAYCCQYNTLKKICAGQPDGGIIVNTTEIKSSVITEEHWPPCYPPEKYFFLAS